MPRIEREQLVLDLGAFFAAAIIVIAQSRSPQRCNGMPARVAPAMRCPLCHGT
jgi:hypothetical protein